MTKRTPLIALNNGVEMPAFGLGVFQSSPEQTVGAVESAIANGYRLIDTAPDPEIVDTKLFPMKIED